MFADFDFSPELTACINRRGYKDPTPIQDQAIKPILSGRDVIGIAKTGSGKTAAYLLPLIQKMLIDPYQRVLIVVPTRELAVQIHREYGIFSDRMRLFSALCIGGVGMYPQISALRKNPHVVIGTPGRLLDLEQQGNLRFSIFQTIVLDEVDRMMDMGFIGDVTAIVDKLPKTRHSLFFSATIPATIRTLMQKFTRDPLTISLTTQEPVNNIAQDIVKTNGKPKIEVLHDLLIASGVRKVLLFGRTKWGIDKLLKLLLERGFKAAAIHGNKRQSQRQRALDDFRSNNIQILLATDVASRGIDVAGVTHVINYDLPQSYEDYIHRIGRTGRANASGTALTFVD